MASIADRIKMLRTNAGLTQQEFGDIFGIVKSTVSLYESGKSCPNDQMKLKICNYFHVPLDFLIGISNIAEYQNGEFNKGMLSDGCCRSAFLDLLEMKKMSVEDIMESTGLDREVIDNWFVREVPSLQQLVLVADCLDTTIDYLLGRTKEFRSLDSEERDLIYYYQQLRQMDKKWVVGQMIDLIKKYENEDTAAVAAASGSLKKVSGK